MNTQQTQDLVMPGIRVSATAARATASSVTSAERVASAD